MVDFHGLLMILAFSVVTKTDANRNNFNGFPTSFDLERSNAHFLPYYGPVSIADQTQFNHPYLGYIHAPSTAQSIQPLNPSLAKPRGPAENPTSFNDTSSNSTSAEKMLIKEFANVLKLLIAKSNRAARPSAKSSTSMFAADGATPYEPRAASELDASNSTNDTASPPPPRPDRPTLSDLDLTSGYVAPAAPYTSVYYTPTFQPTSYVVYTPPMAHLPPWPSVSYSSVDSMAPSFFTAASAVSEPTAIQQPIVYDPLDSTAVRIQPYNQGSGYTAEMMTMMTTTNATRTNPFVYSLRVLTPYTTAGQAAGTMLQESGPPHADDAPSGLFTRPDGGLRWATRVPATKRKPTDADSVPASSAVPVRPGLPEGQQPPTYDVPTSWLDAEGLLNATRSNATDGPRTDATEAEVVSGVAIPNGSLTFAVSRMLAGEEAAPRAKSADSRSEWHDRLAGECGKERGNERLLKFVKSLREQIQRKKRFNGKHGQSERGIYDIVRSHQYQPFVTSYLAPPINAPIEYPGSSPLMMPRGRFVPVPVYRRSGLMESPMW